MTLFSPHPFGPRILSLRDPVRINGSLPAYAKTATTAVTEDDT